MQVNQHVTKRSTEFASVKSKDGVSEPSINIDVGEGKEGSEFVEYELNDLDDDREDIIKKHSIEDQK